MTPDQELHALREQSVPYARSPATQRFIDRLYRKELREARPLATTVQNGMKVTLSTILIFVGFAAASGAQAPTRAEVSRSTPITVPLRALSNNPNYFTDGSGKAVYLTGSHTWNDFQDWGTDDSPQPFDFTAYVKMLVAHNHNFTLLWQTELPAFRGLPTQTSNSPDFAVTPQPWQRTGPGNGSDGKPKFDLTKLNQAYFDAREVASRRWAVEDFRESRNVRRVQANHAGAERRRISGVSVCTNAQDECGKSSAKPKVPPVARNWVFHEFGDCWTKS